MPEHQQQPEGPRDFAAFLLELSRGRTIAELTEGLARVVRSVQDTGNKGSLTLTVTISPAKGDREQVEVTDTVTVKAARHDRARSTFFVDKAGRPVRDDPNQRRLFDPGDVADIRSRQSGDYDRSN